MHEGCYSALTIIRAGDWTVVRSTTKTYIAEVLLSPTHADEQFLDHCRYLGVKTHNCMVKEANRRINKYYRDPEVKAIRKKQRKKGYKLSKEEKVLLKARREQYKLSEYDFQSYLKIFGCSVSKYLDANTVQKIASRVWQAAQAVLFGKGKQIHFQRYEDFRSLEGKNNKQGLRFKDGCLVWGKVQIPILVPANDKWLQRALLDRVKFCRICYRWHNTQWRYYLQLVMEGTPPAKPRPKPLDLEVGLDLGPSTISAVSRYGLLFRELGEGIDSIEAEITRLNRKLDRQRRANNPQNYDSAGRIKRLKKGERRVWNCSNSYYKTRGRLRALYAKRTNKLKQSHEMLANEILEQVGRNITIERMSMAGLAKRSRKNKTNKNTGRSASKKRFGKSIQNHAPSKFVDILTRKAVACGGYVLKPDPTPIKASQYDHTDDTYKKVSLDVREKTLSSGDRVHRDPYSGFLLSNLKDGTAIDQEACIARFPEFKYMHDIVIDDLRRQKAAGKYFPSSMGI